MQRVRAFALCDFIISLVPLRMEGIKLCSERNT